LTSLLGSVKLRGEHIWTTFVGSIVPPILSLSKGPGLWSRNAKLNFDMQYSSTTKDHRAYGKHTSRIKKNGPLGPKKMKRDKENAMLDSTHVNREEEC
jgi:hypothetical protein